MITSRDGLPRYAGLEQVHIPGITVKEAGQRMRRLAYFEERLMRLFASRVVLLENRELKLLLARAQYEATQHANALRERVQELRLSKNKLKNSPSEALTVLFNEADHLPGTPSYLAGLVEVLLPALISGYNEYLDTTNHLADYPSVRVVRQNKVEAEDHLALLTQAYHSIDFSTSEREESENWTAHLYKYLAASGGVLGSGEISNLPPKYGKEDFKMQHIIRRDDAFERVWDFEKPSQDEISDYLHYMMSIRLSEINVSEGLAFVLLETEDMPWSFYLDISRHLWDEMRHSMFGEAAVEATFGERAALPMRDYEGVYAYQADPLEQYATLGLEIEGANMKYPPGKRWEWEFSRDDAQHPLMTTFQDFDWADEVLHVNIARRQLDDWFEGGLKAISPFSEAGKKSRDAIKASKPKVRVIPKQKADQ